MKKIFLSVTLVVFLATILISCGKDNKQADSKSNGKQETVSDQTKKPATVNLEKFTGTYVGDGYDKRAEGYDWVGVMVTKWGDSTLFIRVRSRTDQKKATCTFTGTAKLKSENTFAGMYDGSGLMFTFNNDSLQIANENAGEENKLFYYCSGGGSLSGPYAKISGSLDKSQMDSMSFSRVLNFNDNLFEVTSTEDGRNNTLIIKQLGAKGKDNEYTYVYEGTITNAEIGDLNMDNHPDIMIYVSSNDKSRRGSVIGYSSNNGKSLSMTGIPKMTDDPSASKGYRGNDEFAIVEGTLIQRFPVYAEGAAEGSAPVKMRQIQFKLVDGEALRQFKIDKIVEF